MRSLLAFLAAVLAVALVLAFPVLRSRSGPAEGPRAAGAPARGGPRAPEPPEESSTEPPGATSAASGRAQVPAVPRFPRLDDDALRRRLAAVGRADPREPDGLAAALEPILGLPDNARRAVDLLADRELGVYRPLFEDGADLRRETPESLRRLFPDVAARPPFARITPEETGAVVAVPAACGLYLSLEAAGWTPESPVDGHAFVVEVLEALPRVLPPARELLAERLASVRLASGAWLLDASFASEVDALIAAHPELRGLLGSLRVHFAEGLAGGERDAYETLLLSEAEPNPTEVSTVLARLLEEGGDPASVLHLAEELHDREGASEELRRAVLAAVAAAAPVDLAASFLGARAGRGLYAQFALLGERPGGSEALLREYTYLRAFDSDPEKRLMLVSGLRDEAALLSIAWEEPARSVASQAWLTLALQGEPSSERLSDLQRATAWNRISDGAAFGAFHNLASRAERSGSTGLRDEIVAAWVAFVADPASDVPNVEHRLETELRRYLSFEAYEELRAGIEAR